MATLAGHIEGLNWHGRLERCGGVRWCALVSIGGHVDLPQRIIWSIVEQMLRGWL